MQSASTSPKKARLAALGPDKREKDEILLAFGKNLSSLRGATRLSQDKLARRCFLRHDDIAHFERGAATPNLTVLLILAHTLGASVADLTEGLAAPSRTASKSQTLALVASRPGISTPALAEDMNLPAWYVRELIRCLEATGEVARQPPGWRQAHRHPASVADAR
jgi:transcriptional regulator with XRE-family HTH domain